MISKVRRDWLAPSYRGEEQGAGRGLGSVGKRRVSRREQNVDILIDDAARAISARRTWFIAACRDRNGDDCFRLAARVLRGRR